MALNFDGSADKATTPATFSTATHSALGRFRTRSTGAGCQTFFFLTNASSTWLFCQTGGAGDNTIYLYDDDPNPQKGPVLLLNRDCWIGYSRSNSRRGLFVRYDGDNKVYWITGTTTLTRSTNESVVIGNDDFSEWLDGGADSIFLWTAELTLEQLIAQSYNPTEAMYRASLYAHYRTLVGNTRNKDWSGKGNDLTLAGTVTDLPGNPYVRDPDILYRAAAGGTLYTVTVAGSLTPSGALAKQDNKVLAGGLTSSGALNKQANKTLSGALTSSGAIARQVNKLFTGTLTDSGALAAAKTALLSLAGTFTSSGALNKTAQKLFAGALTSSGALQRMTNKVLSGALTSSGAIATIRTRILTLAGTFTNAGALTRQTNKNASGTLTSSGALSKQTNKTFAGALTTSGAIATIRTYVRVYSGALTSSGALIRTTQKSLTGAIAPSGALNRIVNKVFAGTLTSAGAESNIRTRLINVAGAFSASGALVRSARKTLAGNVPSAGAVSRSISKRIAGAWSGAGGLIAQLISATTPIDLDPHVFISKRKAQLFTSARRAQTFVSQRVAGIFISKGKS